MALLISFFLCKGVYFLTFQVYTSAESKSWKADHSSKVIKEEIREDNVHAWIRNPFAVVDNLYTSPPAEFIGNKAKSRRLLSLRSVVHEATKLLSTFF